MTTLDKARLEAELRGVVDWLLKSRLVGHELTAVRAAETVKHAIEALTALPLPVQEGEWVLVPREPTEAMIDAARYFLEPSTERIGRAAYAAYLAASPPAPGAQPDHISEVRQMVAHPVSARVRVKPLVWRTPDNDNPKDPDPDDNLFCADGIGGVYAISRRQKTGPAYLLWPVEDPFAWEGYDTIEAAKSAAQADHTRRTIAVLEPEPSP